MIRIREPKTTALIFSSEKVICTRAKFEQQSLLPTRKYARILQKLGFDVSFNDFKIQNIVASYDLRFSLSLARLAAYHGSFSMYEPELFLVLIYRMKKPRVTILVFPSGKIVLARARKKAEIFEAFKNIYPILMSFKKKK
ncbi:hypothetical protein REPUB_Repub13aG0042400 [Reevesia pubescens]